MAIPISTPTVPDVTLKSFTGLSGHEFQIIGSVPFNRVPVAATFANSQISVASTSVSLSTFQPAGATFAEINIGSNPIRWWDDGKTPTATQGKPLNAGDYYWVEAIANFRMIAQTGTATVTISWYKYE